MTDITPVFHLPKWPALLVEGEMVSSDQAAEILIRTGQWPVMTNDKRWERTIANLSGSYPSSYRVHGGMPQEAQTAAYEDWDEANYVFKEKYGVLDLNYLTNERVASSWVGGAHGWCNWDGDIGSTDYNIGKWPTAEAVFSEWKTIAEAFPYLDLTAQLLNVEAGEAAGEYGGEIPARAVVEYRVKDGKVAVRVPDRMLSIRHRATETGVWNRDERGCTEETLQWALEVTAKAVASRL